MSPILLIEFLSRVYHTIKDFCGVVSEQSIQANLLLIYELLDEMVTGGYIQVASTEKLVPLVQSEPVMVHKVRSPANELSSRVFGIETKVLPGSVADTPVIQQSSSPDSKRNELFVDVVEKMVAIINPDGTPARLEVNGSINIKNFMSGSPEIKMALNEDLIIAASGAKGYGRQVQLDRCTFHKYVTPSDFSVSRELILSPPIGEFAAMTYSVSGEQSLNQPFRFQTFLGDVEASRDKLLTLCLHNDIDLRLEAPTVQVIIPLPDCVSSVSTRLGGDNQSSKFKEADRQLVWKIHKLPGKTEAKAQFRLQSSQYGSINGSSLGPVALEFEVSGYTSSGLRIRHLKIQGTGDKSKPRQHWVRHLTVSDSVVFRL